MARTIHPISAITAEDLADAELQKSRFRDKSEYDSAVIGTATTEHGQRVLVYDDQALIDLVAEELRASGQCDDDDDVYGAAADNIYYRLSDYLIYEKGQYAPFILTEAPDDPESYDAEETLYGLADTLYH